MTNEKRLLKDLPFERLTKGTVLVKRNGNYEVGNFETYYETGGSSSNSTWVYSGAEKEIIDIIWDNSDWFEEASLKHIDIILGKEQITLKFDPISAETTTALAKGIQRILPHLNDGSYTWNGMGDVTTKIKNN